MAGTPPRPWSRAEKMDARRCSAGFLTLVQLRIPGLGDDPVLSEQVFPSQLSQSRQCPTDLPTSQPDPDNSSLRLSSQFILGCVKLEIKN